MGRVAGNPGGEDATPANHMADEDTLRRLAHIRAVGILAILVLALASEVEIAAAFWPLLLVAALYSLIAVVPSLSSAPHPTDYRLYSVGDILLLTALVALSGGAESDLRPLFLVLPPAAAIVYSGAGVVAVTLGCAAGIAFGSIVHQAPPSTAHELARLLVALAILGVLSLILSDAIRHRTRRVEHLSHEQRVLLAESLVALDGERSRIADELHDGPLQTILAARQDVHEAIDGNPEGLGRSIENLDLAEGGLRRTIGGVHPVALAHIGLAAALRPIVEQAERRGMFTVGMRVSGLSKTHHDPLVFGLVREFLGNAAKHSSAKHVDVDVKRARDTINLKVSDDGCGMPKRPDSSTVKTGHIGFAAATARVRAAGGDIELVSEPGAGTTVLVWLPVDSNHADK